MKRPNSSETVSIANLKAKLAHYLRKVQAGNEVIITEHRRPVAKIIQLDANESLELVRANGSFSEVADKKPKPLSEAGSVDSLAYLLEERGKR